MAVNLLEEDRLVYHDVQADTLEIKPNQTNDYLTFETFHGDVDGDNIVSVYVNRDAVQTLHTALGCWLETGKLTTNNLSQDKVNQEIHSALKGYGK